MPYNFAAPQQGAYQGFENERERQGRSDLADQQSRLALQMQSKLLEQQSQQRMAEAKQKQAMEMLPPDEMQALSGLYGGLQQSLRTGKSPEFDLSKFSTQPGQAAAKQLLDIYASHAMAMSKAEAYQVPWYSDTTGQRIGYKSFNQMGSPIAQKQDPGAADKEKQGIAFLNFVNNLDRLDAAEKGIDFGRVSGILSSGKAALGLDDGNMARFRAYKTLVSSMATPLVTGSHRFAPAEQAQLQNMLGTAFNTGPEVKAAADAMRSIAQIGSANLGLGEDPAWMQKHAARLAAMHLSQPLGAAPNPAQAPAPQGNPGMGGLTQQDFAAEDARRASLRGKPKQAGAQ